MEKIQVLIEKYLNGETTPQEEKELLDWYNRRNEAELEWLAEHPSEEEQVRTRLLENIHNRIEFKNDPRSHSYNWRRLLAAASIFFILVTAGILTFSIFHKANRQYAGNASKAVRVVPGGNKATLTLANGQKVLLEAVHNGQLTQQGGASVQKADSGKLVYTGLSDNKTVASVYNTITIPYGGQFQITLQDGTRVWLNAGSSLKYPTTFQGPQRRVELSGEGYFEVAKNKAKPFTVDVKTPVGPVMSVRVLGTHFNINAYADEHHNATTLLEGAVKITCGSQSALLVPGREALLDKATGTIKTQPADIDGATAWKNGYLMFDNNNLQQIMRQIARWYDVEVVYEGDISRKAIGGSVSRFSNVSEVLKMIELTGAVHFKTEGRRITVMP